ncbi:MAG: hypothetical protein BWK72_00055 [Rhodoferax ferrireducens]|uniref:Uncharacterized protein n=1 Tax=Rhodoferax ferrireducens TaxID=192843 RepID=A0A1W9KZR7_9BURK|nr:MAG: hypothetical protein BWK72_00055 [Rhodoferax ferrireducens]
MPEIKRFTDEQLEHVIEQGLIYLCACPSQVAQSIRQLRQLYDYQQSCLLAPGTDHRVHQAIAATVQTAHALMEDCMEQVLAIEQWDRTTLDMPADLRQRQMREI